MGKRRKKRTETTVWTSFVVLLHRGIRGGNDNWKRPSANPWRNFWFSLCSSAAQHIESFVCSSFVLIIEMLNNWKVIKSYIIHANYVAERRSCFVRRYQSERNCQVIIIFPCDIILFNSLSIKKRFERFSSFYYKTFDLDSSSKSS